MVKHSSHGQSCRDNFILFLFLSSNEQSFNGHINPFAIEEQCGKRISIYLRIKINLGGNIFQWENVIYLYLLFAFDEQLDLYIFLVCIE